MERRVDERGPAGQDRGRARCRRRSAGPARPSARRSPVSARSFETRGGQRGGSSGATTSAGLRAAQLGGGLAVGRHRREDRTAGREVRGQLARQGHVGHRRPLVDDQDVGRLEHRLVAPGGCGGRGRRRCPAAPPAARARAGRCRRRPARSGRRCRRTRAAASISVWRFCLRPMLPGVQADELRRGPSQAGARLRARQVRVAQRSSQLRRMAIRSGASPPSRNGRSKALGGRSRPARRASCDPELEARR